MPAYGEAMLFAGDDFGSEPPLDGMTRVDVDGVRAFLDTLPTRTALEAMNAAERRELRDARLAALSHYLLSLSRRDGFWNKLFHQEPEREGRDP